MTAAIKYTVKYHATRAKKAATVLFGFGGVIILLLDLIWTPFRGLTPEFQALALTYIIPNIFWYMNMIAILSVLIGLVLLRFKWRSGKLSLTDEKLIIDGSYYVSIWLKNLWEVEIRDMGDHRTIRVDSNVDAVQMAFDSGEEFEGFSEKLVAIAGQIENIRLKITT